MIRTRHTRTAALVATAVLGTAAMLLAQTQSLTTLFYEGAYRAGAKTTMHDAPPQNVASIAALRAQLPPDQRMRARYRTPDMASFSRAPDWQRRYNGRVQEERRVVRVTANLYAVKLESGENGDNDFHLIVGDTRAPRTLMNVEISGVPRGASPAVKRRFIAVRQQLLDVLGPNRRRFQGRYRRIDPPLRVRLTGSLFFDADHVAGTIGPQGMRPSTVWEIHPVHTIEQAATR